MILNNMAQSLTGYQNSLVLDILKNDNLTIYEALDKLFTTTIWFEPELATRQRFSHSQHPLYTHHFKRVSREGYQTNDLAKHTSEIQYVFGNLTPIVAYNHKDVEISQAMQHAWVTFSRHGVPHYLEGSKWPEYRSNAPYVTYIEDGMTYNLYKPEALTMAIHDLR